MFRVEGMLLQDLVCGYRGSWFEPRDWLPCSLAGLTRREARRLCPPAAAAPWGSESAFGGSGCGFGVQGFSVPGFGFEAWFVGLRN